MSIDERKIGQKPSVSAIMIFLNEERFIQEAIQSVFDQTHENWELLLVDDGSTDGSTEIARRWAEQYPKKVCYLDHPGHENRGMSASRNLGLHHAAGRNLAFLDADDQWMPRKLENQLAILQLHPEAAMVCGRAEYWYSWTGNANDKQRDMMQTLDVPLDALIEPPELLSLFLQNEWASICDILVRHEAVTAVGGYEDSFRGMYEDQVFNAKLCLRFPAYVASGSWYRYRQHSEACTTLSHKSGKYYEARLTFLNWLRQYLSTQGQWNSEVWKVVQKELWSLRHPRLARLSERLQRLPF